MPYILGQVSETTDSGPTPCMDFQVECPTKSHIESLITYAPPYFWVTVPKDEYPLQIISATGATTTAVAKVLSDFGGVRLPVSIP